ncbi:MAG: metal-dependent hydrolase [Chloroflexi bacterium]|nr:metal-dependent hydrolase [Chloroflexota bacterium]
MLLLGHTGITLGAAVLLAGVVSRTVAPTGRSWLTLLASRIDIRLLMVGALLPDLIDKPVGQFFFRETFSHGRIFSHTLLFLLALTLAGIYLRRRYGSTWLLALSAGTLTHLAFDEMWRAPATLFWPMLGLAFDRIDLAEWMPNILHALLNDPSVYVPELLGAGVLAWLGVTLLRRRKLRAFVRHGQV